MKKPTVNHEIKLMAAQIRCSRNLRQVELATRDLNHFHIGRPALQDDEDDALNAAAAKLQKATTLIEQAQEILREGV